MAPNTSPPQFSQLPPGQTNPPLTAIAEAFECCINISFYYVNYQADQKRHLLRTCEGSGNFKINCPMPSCKVQGHLNLPFCSPIGTVTTLDRVPVKHVVPVDQIQDKPSMVNYGVWALIVTTCVLSVMEGGRKSNPNSGGCFFPLSHLNLSLSSIKPPVLAALFTVILP